MARRRTDHRAARNDIADAAVKTILRLGLHNCSLKDIADESGYTTGKLMYYFRDKDELLFFTKNRLFDLVWEKAKSLSERYEGIDRIVAMVMTEIPFTVSGRNRHRVLSEFKVRAFSSRKALKMQAKRDEEGWLHFEEVINELKMDGYVDKKVDGKLAAFGIIAFVEGIAAHFIIAPKVQDKESVQEIVEKHVRAMLS